MKRIIFLAGISLLVLTGTLAQEANSLLWKISSPAGETSYLFGTYHLINSGFLEENPKVKKAYEEAETVVVETVIDSSRLMEMSMLMMMQGKTLRDLLDSSEYILVDTTLQGSLGMGLAMFNTIKPMAINTMYAAALAQQNLPEDLRFSGQPMDMYFASNGKKNGKEIVALETMMEQTEMLFNSESLEEQADALVEVMRERDEALRMTIALSEAYKNEQLKKMREIADESGDDYGTMKVLLEDRNKNWIPELQPILDKGDAFIAVGALHLTGEDGLIALLKEKAYKLEPVE